MRYATDKPAARIPLPGLLDVAAEALLAEFRGELEEAGYDDIRPTHGCVFRFVREEGMRLTELASNAGMTKQSAGELVDDLVELGYVERIPDPADRRAKLICLTERGREAQRSASASSPSSNSAGPSVTAGALRPASRAPGRDRGCRSARFRARARTRSRRRDQLDAVSPGIGRVEPPQGGASSSSQATGAPSSGGDAEDVHADRTTSEATLASIGTRPLRFALDRRGNHHSAMSTIRCAGGAGAVG